MKLENSGIRSIQDSFLTLKRGFHSLLGALIFLIVVGAGFIFYIIRNSNEKIYVISPHQTFLAYADFDHETSVYEARNHVKTFCENMFGWDKDSYKNHLEYALNLIDHTDGLKLFNTLKASQVYENLVSTSAKVTITMDSILLNMKSLPIQGLFYCTQNWQSPGGVQNQKIKAHFELISVSRAELNPYGLEIQKILFLEYVNKIKESKDSLLETNSNP
jgi:hypothetical protein